jgi:hypothetical protein
MRKSADTGLPVTDLSSAPAPPTTAPPLPLFLFPFIPGSYRVCWRPAELARQPPRPSRFRVPLPNPLDSFILRTRSLPTSFLPSPFDSPAELSDPASHPSPSVAVANSTWRRRTPRQRRRPRRRGLGLGSSRRLRPSAARAVSAAAAILLRQQRRPLPKRTAS